MLSKITSCRKWWCWNSLPTSHQIYSSLNQHTYRPHTNSTHRRINTNSTQRRIVREKTHEMSGKNKARTSSQLVRGDRVLIIAGPYQGCRATFLSHCSHSIEVRINHGEDSKYLNPGVIFPIQDEPMRPVPSLRLLQLAPKLTIHHRDSSNWSF